MKWLAARRVQAKVNSNGLDSKRANFTLASRTYGGENLVKCIPLQAKTWKRANKVCPLNHASVSDLFAPLGARLKADRYKTLKSYDQVLAAAAFPLARAPSSLTLGQSERERERVSHFYASRFVYASLSSESEQINAAFSSRLFA